MNVFEIIMRLLHIGSAILLIGGMAFMLVSLLPALKPHEPPVRDSVTGVARKRFARIMHPAIAGLLISGAYQWMKNHDRYEAAGAPLIQALLGTKVLIALAAFVIAFASSAGVLRGCPSRWVKINLALTTVVIVLAVVIRQLRLGA
ncbi:MAG: hypothetical protein R3236_04765 [Phycisphaeraceae bacterium]|nr:hypothetical protein [Phycisphaeraceae bacterium]